MKNVSEDRKIRMSCRYGKRVRIGLEGVKSDIFRTIEIGCVSWNTRSENRIEGNMDVDLKNMSR